MSNKNNQPNPKGNGKNKKLPIKMENLKYLNSGTDVYDFGNVLDSNPANTQKSVTITYSDQGTPTSATVESDTGAAAYICMILPTIGGYLGRTRCQMAFKDQFIKVVGDAYYSSGISEADLIKLYFYCEGLGALLVQVDRFLKLSSDVQSMNNAVAQPLSRVCGFVPISGIEQRQLWIDARNRLAKLINDKFYLADNEALRSYYNLLNHVYLDSGSTKAQPILFVSPCYTDIDQINGDVGIGNGFIGLANDLPTSNFGLNTFSQIIADAEAFSLSAWYNTVAPFLHHLYGGSDTGLYLFSMYREEPIAYTFDYNIVIALRNSKNVYLPISIDSSETGRCKIWENSAGNICQGGSNTSGYECMQFQPAVGVSGIAKVQYFNTHWVNLDDWPASADDKAHAMTFYAIEGAYRKPGTSSTYYTTVDWCNHVLLLATTAIRLISSMPYFSRIGTTKDVIFLPAQLTNAPTSKPDRTWLTSNFGSDWLELMTMLTSNISHGVWVFAGFVGLDSNNAIVTWTLYATYGQFDHDKDNRFEVPDVQLENFYVQQAYDQFWFTTPDFKSRGKVK